jgi:hypothetical protein
MSQQSEERVSESTPDDPQSAQILHLKSTPYVLQRAIQQRAQESVEREAELDREQRRPKPLKWTIAFLIACVPIALTLFFVDGFLRVFHRYLDTISTQEQTQAAEAAEAAAQQAPADTTSSQPGVVMLQSVTPQEPAPAEQDASKSQTPDSTATPDK